MTNERVTFENPDDTAVIAHIDLKAPQERVYAAWTKPEQFRQWFGPRSGTMEVEKFDCIVGGSFALSILFSDGDRVRMIGEYRELDPIDKLVFTWQWFEDGAPSNETLVTVNLSPNETGTHLKLTHERFIKVQDRDNHQSGWGSLLPQIDEIVTA